MWECSKKIKNARSSWWSSLKWNSSRKDPHKHASRSVYNCVAQISGIDCSSAARLYSMTESILIIESPWCITFTYMQCWRTSHLIVHVFICSGSINSPFDILQYLMRMKQHGPEFVQMDTCRRFHLLLLDRPYVSSSLIKWCWLIQLQEPWRRKSA